MCAGASANTRPRADRHGALLRHALRAEGVCVEIKTTGGGLPLRSPAVQHLDWLENAAIRRRARAAIKWSIALTVALYLIPYGSLVAYPLLLLSTLFHELGHGVVALCVGGSFERFVMFADGSGMATSVGVRAGVPSALVSAGGLVGPAIVGAVAFAAGRSARASRTFLTIAALLLAVAVALVVRNPFGVTFTLAVAALLGYLGVRTAPATAQLASVFLATQLALSVFSRADYLFTDVARTGAGTIPSDTAHIASALGGTYWLWGIACGVFSVIVLLGGVAWFWRVLRER